MTSPLSPLDTLDRRIVAALQVDGRAGWSKIATALAEAERTVARRGTRLLDEGLVTVTALPAWHRLGRRETSVVELRCAPATSRFAATALARRQDTTFTYLVAGTADCVAEIWSTEETLPTLLLDELPGTPGMVTVVPHPILRYFRTVHEWQPGILTPDEVAALETEGQPADVRLVGPPARLSEEDRAILQALAGSGRRTHDELARLAGVSETTARRRLDALRAEGLVYFRAVVEPALLGLPVEALLWIRTAPGDVDAVGEEIIASPLVRYAAAIMGRYQLLVDVTAPDKAALHTFLTHSSWSRTVNSVESSLVIHAFKRSAVLSPDLRIRDDVVP